MDRIEKPSVDQLLNEAKMDSNSSKIGMYLVHNGIVRETPKAKVREGIDDGTSVTGIEFSYNNEKVEQAIKETYNLPGVYYIKVWLNSGYLKVGEDIMYVLIGGDIRPNVIKGLEHLVGKIKTECVVETEIK